jgi:signal transduction histidine kinase
MQPQADVEIGGRLFSPSLRLMSDEDGRTTILLRDVTERRQLDERRLDFYSMIAHDLRTPLSSITLRVHLMQKDPYIASTPSLNKGVLQIDRNLRSLVAMINDFLELASLDGGRYRLERAEVDLTSLIDKAADDLAPLMEAKAHTWTIRSKSPGQVKVVGDASRLHQALTNLIANAIKFTPDGGDISASVDVTAHDVQISITDNGRGIDPAVLTTLFQRYRRADQSVAGSGLGLMIVREIIEAHGGMVGADSTLGAGSRFWLRLPRKAVVDGA